MISLCIINLLNQCVNSHQAAQVVLHSIAKAAGRLSANNAAGLSRLETLPLQVTEPNVEIARRILGDIISSNHIS